MSKLFSPSPVACQCGANHYSVLAKPLFRFVCHCEVCQAYTGKPFSDVTLHLTKNIQVGSLASTEFKTWRSPPNIKRGTCLQCNSPVVEYGLLDKLAFVPASLYKDASWLPAPELHIFYHRRRSDVNDGVRKCSGYAASQLAFARVLVGKLMR